MTTTPSFVSSQVTAARRYFLDLNPSQQDAITVVCGGREQVRADYRVKRDSFPFLCLEFVADGEGSLQLDDEEYRLEGGSVFTYGGDVTHTIATSEQRLMTKYYVDFVGRHAERLLEQLALEPGKATRVWAPHEIQELFDLLQTYGLSQSPFSQQLCASLIPTLLWKVAERCLPPGMEPPGAWTTYQHLKREIATHYLEIETMDQAARRCHISVPYACRLFRRFDHISPYQFLLRQKLNHAAELLSAPNILVKQVAAQLGFTDQYQFSRAFKRAFGLSPRQFQQRR